MNNWDRCATPKKGTDFRISKVSINYFAKISLAKISMASLISMDIDSNKNNTTLLLQDYDINNTWKA